MANPQTAGGHYAEGHWPAGHWPDFHWPKSANETAPNVINRERVTLPAGVTDRVTLTNLEPERVTI